MIMQQTKYPPLRILMASAGSGKTFAITVHFLRLVLANPSSYKEILALTFTNKATGEMKKRILETLEAIASHPESVKSSPYVEALKAYFPDWPLSQFQKQAEQAYKRILHDYGRLSVMTIDKFSQQIIRSFTYELGLDSGYKLEINDRLVIPDLIQRLYEKLDTSPALFDWLLKHMLELIENDKSWNINRTLADLAEKNIFKDAFKRWEANLAEGGNENLFDDLSKSIAKQIKEFEDYVEQIVDFIAAKYQEFGISTEDLYNKTKNAIRKFENPDQLKGDYATLQNLNVFVNNLESYQKEKTRKSHVEGFYYAINDQLSRLVDYIAKELPLINLLEAVKTNLPYLKLMRDLAGLMAEWRADNGAQVLADAQVLLSKIGQTSAGDPTFIWEKIGNRYKYFLFDEFQDTSHAQWNNLKPLLLNALGERGNNNPAHLIVGDVKQSIYRWRDGDFRILLDGVEQSVAETFGVKDTAEFLRKDNLAYNYRSSRNIIEFNNHLYRHAPLLAQNSINVKVNKQNSVELSDKWESKRLHDTIVRAYEGVEQKYPEKKDDDSWKGRVEVEFVKVDVQYFKQSEGAFRAEAIVKSLDQIQSWIDKGQFKASEIGVLIRVKDHATDIINTLEALRSEKGYSFEMVSGDVLYLDTNSVVSALIATMRYLAFEGKDYNVFLAQLVQQYSKSKNITLDPSSWVDIGNGDISKLSQVLPASVCENWQSFKQLPISILVEQLISVFEFGNDEQSLPYLNAFIDVVNQFVNVQGGGLLEFLNYWDQRKEDFSLPGGAKRNAVEILTIHKSKGLEYEAVILPFCIWELNGRPKGQVWFELDVPNDISRLGSAPLRFGSANGSAIQNQYFEEELYNYMDALNNFYVATTRAKQALRIFALYKKKYMEGYDPEKLTSVGDILYYSASEHPNWDEEHTRLLIGEEVPEGRATKLVTAKEEANEYNLKSYSSSDLLQAILAQRTETDTTIRDKRRASAQFSTNLHELMATLKSAVQIESEVAYFQKEGRFNEEEAKQATKLLQQAWAHPILGPLLATPYKQSNEKAIIDEQGDTWRPDKVLLGENETIVIDFKLTAMVRDPKHIAQLKGYIQFLIQMGLPSVKGYLYYFLQNEMEEVR